jgi:long-chain fatty acid transport protein
MSTFTSFRRVALGTSLLLGLAPVQAMASGFYIIEQSAKATGRAYSGEVADTGPESLWWNPASIVGQQGVAISMGASAILPRANADNIGTLIVRPGQAPAPVGGDQRTTNPINNGVVPSGAIAYGITNKVAVGLAVTAPFNFTTDYPATSWARYTAQRTSLRTIDVQPSIAVEPIAGLRLGLALNVEHTTASLGSALPNLSPLLPDGSQVLNGKGWDFGFSAGAQFHQGPLTIGASYKSQIKHSLDGSVTTAGLLGPLAGNNGTITTTASFTTPWQAMVGARYAVTSAITVNGQITRTGWAKFDAITLGAPINAAIPENYRNTWAYAAGIDVALSPKWTVRTGVQRDLTPVQDNQRDARVPDTNRWTFAMGATHQVNSHIAVDLAANYLSLSNGPINRVTAAFAGTPVQTPILVNGNVNDAHVFILALGGRFNF